MFGYVLQQQEMKQLLAAALLAVVPQQMLPPLAAISVYQNQTTTDRIYPEPPTLRIADPTRTPGRRLFPDLTNVVRLDAIVDKRASDFTQLWLKVAKFGF